MTPKEAFALLTPHELSKLFDYAELRLEELRKQNDDATGEKGCDIRASIKEMKYLIDATRPPRYNPEPNRLPSRQPFG